jgi:hypothetical protein
VFSGNNVDTVVQRTVTGGRILEVIRGSKSPTTFVYDMTLPAGSQILPDKGGSDLLIGKKTQDAQGNVTFDVQQVIAPVWAVDANGKSLPAKYTVDGTKITMSVDTTGATFPVTADPTWEKGGFRVVWSNWTPWSASVYLNRDRTDDFMDGNTGACGVLILVPIGGTWLTLGCVAMMWLVKTGSRIAGWCARYIVSAFSPTRPQLYWYNGGFCT